MMTRPLLLVALAGALALTQGVSVSWAAKPLEKAPMSDDPLTLYADGAVMVATGKIDAAEKLANAALKNHPAAHGFHLILGDVHVRRKHFADAYYEWQWEFLRAGPGSTTGDLAANRISNLLSSQRGPEVDEVRRVLDAVMLTVKDPKAAFLAFERVEAERGDRLALTHFKAEALHQQGSEQAADLYRECIRVDSTLVAAYVQLASLHKSKGREKEALELMTKARGIDPGNWRLRGM